MGDERETDYWRIVKELRQASAEALEEARRDPARSATLLQKAHSLNSAAERIEEDAQLRESFVSIERVAAD